MRVLFTFRCFLFLSVLVLLPLTLGACTSTGGINSVPGIADRFNDATASPYKITTVSASCNPGEQMVGGGWAINTPAYNGSVDVQYPLDQYFVSASYPSSSNTWTAVFVNRSRPFPGSDALGFVHVECLSTGATPTIVSAVGTLLTTVTASCPSGSILTGGGYELTNLHTANQVVAFTLSRPDASNEGSPSAWSVSANDVSHSQVDSSNQIMSFAVCTTQSLSATIGTSVKVSAPPGEPDLVTQGVAGAPCASGQAPLSGGFVNYTGTDGNLAFSNFYASYASSPLQWGATLKSLPNADIEGHPKNGGGSATIIPVCAPVSG